MPGLSQLVQFNKDILSLGDEIQLRAQRGERPVRVQIPKDIPDVDDSDEFIVGMPEKEAVVADTSVDDDLSDLQAITGIGQPSGNTENNADEGESSSAFDAPDMSSLLAPVDAGGEGEDGMPDLSMFDDPVLEEPEEPAEPEPPSVADMSLDDLLGGAGFDGSEISPMEEEVPEVNLEDEEFYSGGFGDDNYIPMKKSPKPKPAPVIEDFEEVESIDDISLSEEDNNLAKMLSGQDEADLDDVEEIEEAEPENPEFFSDLDEVSEFEDEFAPIREPVKEKPDNGIEYTDDFGEIADDLESISHFGEFSAEDYVSGDGSLDNLDIPESEELDTAESFDLPDGDDGMDLPEAAETDSFDLPEANGLDLPEADSLDTAESFDLPDGDDGMDLPEAAEADSFDLPEADGLDLPEAESVDIPEADGLDLLDAESADLPEADSLDTAESFDLPDSDDGMDLPEATEADSFDLPEADGLDLPESEGLDLPETADLDMPELNDGFGSDFNSVAGGIDDMPSLDDIPSIDDDMSSMDAELPEMGADDFGAVDDMGGDIPAGLFDASDVDMDLGDTPGVDEGPVEDFDMSAMEGMDFGITDTDAALAGGSDFELGTADDFGIEGQDFEIPGFSDVETAKEEKHAPLVQKNIKIKENDLPPNTLSDEQYKIFLKNLGEYPLNVRLAFEDLIVRDEFTEDAEFEVIEKILHKAPARQVATLLEKMLDISLPVPRDFEHRTAEEYEAYKKSLSYQLKNKIIPIVFVLAVLCVVGYGLVQFGIHCIYRPVKAQSLYKQGYVLLQADEYPQSEIKFNEATEYGLKKDWFFKYARGYRERNQYIRAEKMYSNILNCFNHDKSAGLEYADMELSDLANYERAEEIVRREVLDYHINDKDGILLLGDVFLEWGTEKDPEKLELARQQYAILLQLYGSNNLYLSRMMRYFVRTDNLRQVLQLKEIFLPKEKNLSAEDWTELSGFLLEKLYGPLAPSDEYLRSNIEDVFKMLTRAVKLNPKSPMAMFNLSRYFIETGEFNAAKDALHVTIDNFKEADRLHRRDIYKYIDSYRLLGEQYCRDSEFLRAQENYTEGISLYTAERDSSGFKGTPEIGKLFADQADIDYFVSGDYDNALLNYQNSVNLNHDNASIRYRMGYVQYKKKNYADALGSFMKAGEANIKPVNLLLAMANTLSLRGDDYAAQGYYDDLISQLDNQIAVRGLVLPQVNKDDYDVVHTYLTAANNYGVTLHRLAARTGNSELNAQAIVQLSQSVRAWDALTRNQATMVRLEGSNLAQENIKYVTRPLPDFEPAIYVEIPRVIDNIEDIN